MGPFKGSRYIWLRSDEQIVPGRWWYPEKWELSNPL